MKKSFLLFIWVLWRAQRMMGTRNLWTWGASLHRRVCYRNTFVCTHYIQVAAL